MRHAEAVPGKPHAGTSVPPQPPLGLVTWRPLPRASWRGPSSQGLEGQPCGHAGGPLEQRVACGGWAHGHLTRCEHGPL